MMTRDENVIVYGTAAGGKVWDNDIRGLYQPSFFMSS